ncbi:hypothetical protein GCM10010433_60240 [Streptomyces pulveraceus]
MRCGWGAVGSAGSVGGPLRGARPLPAPSLNRGPAPDPGPQTPDGLKGADELNSADGLSGAGRAGQRQRAEPVGLSGASRAGQCRAVGVVSAG